jgi:hypothetical protein
MHQFGVTRRWCWLTLAGLVLAFAALSPLLTSASGAGSGGTSSSTAVAPSAVLSVGPARIVSGKTRIATPRKPAGQIFNRPTIPMAQYRAMKEAAAKAPRIAKPLQLAPLSTNGLIGSAPRDGECGPGGCWVPPDVNGSVGRSAPFSNQLAEVTNDDISVYTKAAGPSALLSNISLSTLVGYSAAALTDPRVEYDTRWNRWVATMVAFQEASGDQHFFVAISPTSDATGGWIVYNFLLPFNGTCFHDYPQLGLNQDAIIVTYSDFCPGGETSRTFAFAKALAYNGVGISTPLFTIGPGTTTPPNVLDQNPRAHELLWVPGAGASNVEYRNPQAGAYSAIAAITPLTGELRVAPPPNARQPIAPPCTAPSCDISTLDGRYQNDPTQYGDRLWSANTVLLGGPFPSPEWHEWDVEGAGANMSIQGGLTFVSPSSFDWNASISAQPDGRAYLNWSYDDPESVYPGMAFTGRLASDPLSTMNPATIVVLNTTTKLMGSFDPNFGAQRWGDTSSARFDPNIFDRAYLFNETVPSTQLWGTQSAAVHVTP